MINCVLGGKGCVVTMVIADAGQASRVSPSSLDEKALVHQRLLGQVGTPQTVPHHGYNLHTHGTKVKLGQVKGLT